MSNIQEKMQQEGETSDTSFTSTMTLTKMGLSNVPQRFILPPSQRPNSGHGHHSTTNLPIIDLSNLNNPSHRARTIDDISAACKKLGFFQVINHGISTLTMNDAIDVAREFFNLPSDEKMHLASANVHNPVRYGTSLNHMKDKVHFWRDFIKHYSHPIEKWIEQWPSNPPSYKKKMGEYTKATYLLQKQLMQVVFQSLGLNPTYLQEDIDGGSQVMAVNYYPACPQPELALGMPPHSDFGSLTIINQSQEGLEIMDRDKKWHPVPLMEIMSNGKYKSVIHRATVNAENKRISIASLHSLSLDKGVVPAPELVDEQHPISYNEGSFSDFLSYISGNDITEGRYIDTLKK
ncbi:hypothetical protein DCAR_0933947 [Daucus carota subsp. sativus]|uniref:Fe2OG dioxygenase domain-containing protein n=1 Tax=Daucus carota subsp. sativus TaxID=79200 RepID=A0AAF0XUE7_DAUCS|nr:hypothetical protein DCAR_0933947 [Daucus carota subsp. sativus]